MTTGQAPKPRGGAGTVAVISGELSRYSIFAACLMNALGYSGQIISHFDWLMGSNVTGNCNDAVKRMKGDWLWLIGDDHVFQPDILDRLVAHNVDVIVPHCLTKTWPFGQVHYEGEEDDPAVQGTHLLHTGIQESGLMEVYASGQAGMLIRRRVLEKLGEDPFRTFGKQNEDLEFCRRVREAGFKIHLDPTIRLGHIGQVIVWPEWNKDLGEWGIGLDFGAGEPTVFLRRFQTTGSLAAA